MASQQPPIVSDDILKRLQDMEHNIVNQKSSKISDKNIINEPINPSIMIQQFSLRFHIPHIKFFKEK